MSGPLVRVILPAMFVYHAIFDVISIVLLVFCLVDALRKNPWLVGGILLGVAFGLTLEWATIRQLKAYHYGLFPLMLDDVPVSIGIGWGVIIYAAHRFVWSRGLSGWQAAIVASLFALFIDLGMDVIAIRLDMWDWGIPLDQDFLGVRFGNYWAWSWVVFSFSLVYNLLFDAKRTLIKALAPLAAYAGGLAGVLGTNALLVWVIPQAFQLAAVLAVVAGVAVSGFFILQRPVKAGDGGVPGTITRKVPLPSLVVMGVFHFTFIIMALVSGIFAANPVLLEVSGVALAGSSALLGMHPRTKE